MDENLTDIAIIGMAGRFPGARNIEELWQNLCDGRECVRFFSVEELEDPHSRALARESTTYVRARAIMDDVEQFDAAFFGIYPREAELIDPQQRIFLECCWHAFENAGYDPLMYGGVTGVYAGCSPNSYFSRQICGEPELIAKYSSGYQVSDFITTLGTNSDFLATRVAYKLNLKGPAFSLSCGCSTSLVAVTQACLALQNYQVDMALAGGVSITFPQRRGYLYEPGGMVSADGHCRTFDERAQGTVFGDGAAVILLKRLEDAIAAGDHIYAVIKGFGITNDGTAKVGFTAPGVEGQARAIAMAHAAAGVEPQSISYVEAHGTGTPLGDPIEIAALTRAFRHGTQERGFCAIGTAKTNIGHLDIAAGVTGLIKTALSLSHRLLPPILHFQQPNPALDLENSPFYVNTKLTAWQRRNTPLRAGVSAFGVGGTNVHIVLEEAPDFVRRPTSRDAHLLVLSSKSDQALETLTDTLAARLESNPAPELSDLAHSLMTGGHSFAKRRYAVVRDSVEAATVLRSKDPSRVVTGACEAKPVDVAFMFPGQGAQYVRMGRQLYDMDSGFRTDVDQSMSILKSSTGVDLGPILYPDSQTSADSIDDTQFAQPAIFITEYALARLWMRLGIHPAAMIGHSVGEFVAACIAGVFSLEDAIRTIAERGRLIQSLPSGTMLSIALGEAQVLPLINDGLSIAAINGPSLTVVAGPEVAVSQLEDRLGKEQIICRRLRTSHAFHSAMMGPAQEPLVQLLRTLKLSAPTIPFISGVTARWITDTEATDPTYWGRHLREPVRFASGVRELCDKGYALLEVGPGRALSVLARQQAANKRKQLIVASMPERTVQQGETAALLNAIGQLWLSGAQPNWSMLYSGEKPRRVPLPPYPFERKQCWVKRSTGDVEARSVAARNQQFSPDEVSSGTPVGPGVDQSSVGPCSEPAKTAVPDFAEAEGKTQMESASGSGRLERIRLQLGAIFQDLSGIDLLDTSGSASFLELGFDSLFLTQVSQALYSKFGLKITFRQLLDQFCTLDLLSAHFDQSLPPDPPTAVASTSLKVDSHGVAAASNASPAPSIPAAPSDVASSFAVPAGGNRVPQANSSSFEHLFKMQLQTMSDLMSKQLEVLRSAEQPTSVQQAIVASGPPTQTIASVTAAPVAALPVLNTNGHKHISEPRKFVPFRPVETQATRDLDPVREQHLRAFIERYTRKTAGSKRFTEANRPRLADPRVVAGFRVEWKELVYSLVTTRSKGSKIWDVDGNEYVDLVNGYGPIMLGHAPEFVTKAIAAQLECGYETGPQSLLAGEVADLICEMTGMERVTFCNTGSEAVVAALRAARTITGRDKVVIFTGAYHGMFDEVVVKGIAGPDGPRSLPVAPGIPRDYVRNMVVLDYGSAEALSYIESHAGELAAVMVEPVQSRHPEHRPVEFLRKVRRLTEQAGAALIFDEVVTGFRVHPGGCQAVFGVNADLATYGKVLAGGLPIGILAGRHSFMDALDGGAWKYGDDSFPQVGVTFFAGTFVRHPLALAAALAMLKHIKQAGPALQEQLAARTSGMVSEMNAFLRARQIPTHVNCFSSFAHFTFPPELKYAGLFYYYMRERGVYIQEGFPIFLTTAHSDDDLARVVTAFKESLAEMQEAGFLPASPVTEVAVPANGTVPAHLNASALAPALDGLSPKTDAPPSHPTETERAKHHAPLTEGQLEIWLSAALGDEASCAYNESITIRLKGQLNRLALEHAIDRLINRHEALRAIFSTDGTFQEFSAELHLTLPIEDLSAMKAEERAGRMSELIIEDARQPFDLIAGPLVRVKLVRTAPDEHSLLFTCHHVVCDGWSTNTLIDELSNLYNALSSGSPDELPAPMAFSEYAKLQAEHFSGPDGAKNEKYWVEQFKILPAPLELPLDYPRPAIKSYDGATVHRVIPEESYRQLKRHAAKNKCTLFAALLAGFQVLLSRLSGQKEVVVGIPAAGQSLLDNNILVGQCVNFLPLRGRLDADPTVAAYLTETKATVLNAYDHQNYTYGRLIRTLSIPRDPSRLPLVEVQFNLERLGDDVQFSELSMEIEPNPKAFVNHDLFLNVIESDRGLILDCDYNTNLFSHETITRWLGYYQTLLEGMAADSGTRISSLPLLPSTESQRLIEDWNDTRADYPRHLCVHQLFEEQVRRTPHAIAAVYQDQSYSYAILDQKAEQLARYLKNLGVSHGTLVGIFVERSLDMLVALLGVLKAGAAYVPMDPTYPAERVAFVVNDANVSVLLTQSEISKALPASMTRLVCLDTDWNEIEKAESSEPGAAVSGDSEELAYVIYTSGSTGKPKGVEIPHRAVVNLLCSMRKKPGITPSDILLAVTTLSFDIAGLELFLPLCVGARVVIASRAAAADGSLLLKLLRDCAATIIQATPITFRLLIEAGWADRIPLRVLCGGEALSRDLANQLIDRSESVWNMYGPTETTIWSSAMQVESGDGPVLIGPPIDNTRFYVLDADDQLVPTGRPGELHIGGEGLARGYLRRPDLSAEKFVVDQFSPESGGRLYKTGDLVRWLAGGKLEFLGRLDNQIKLRGFRIELGEIETAITRYPGVREAVVALREDTPGDKRLVAYIVTEEAALSLTALREFLTGKLPNYMLPSAVVRMEALPQTANGKVNRNALPAPDNAHDPQRRTYSAPSSERERLLADIWAEVLRVERVGTSDNIFELGADSLHMFQIAARASKAGIPIAPASLLRYRTIQDVLKHLDETTETATGTAVMPAIVPVSREKYRIRKNLNGTAAE